MQLITKQIFKAESAVQLVDTPTNRIVCVDVSGSMSSELPKLRTHLKNKLPTMILPQDTLTIIWFSGKNQYGILFEAIKLDTLSDISKVNAAIDRFLTPVGLTGFTQPLQEVLALTKKLSGDCTLSFMTDGWDNCGKKSEILSVCAALSEELASVTFVEYGYYADHATLMEMAEEVGGSVVLAEKFINYSESLDSSLKSQVSGKKIKINKITAKYVIGNQADGFVIARPDAVGTVTLPANTVSYSYFEGSGDITAIDNLGAPFAVAALIQRGEADKALEIAALVGDETLFKQVENSFSKQDFAVSVELANAYGTGKKKLYSDAPFNNKLVQDPNAYNVLTLLMDLASEEGNYLDITHPDFEYNPIGAKRETAEIGEGEAAFKPVFKDKDGDIKAEITALKFDEDRPNINILVRREGMVTLPKNDLGFKDTVESFIWRNYAIVKDGIVNVRKLPVVLSKASYDLLTHNGVIDEPFKIGKTYVIDTKKFPVINRSMVVPTTAESLFHDCFKLHVLRTKQKVLGSKIEKPEFGQKFAALYGDEGAKFLKELGISEGGFSPKTVKGESIDAYVAKVLEIKLAGLSSIPSIADVEKAIAANKKLTVSQEIMEDIFDSIKELKDFAGELKKTKKEIRDLLNKIIMTKFGIILGKKWFTDITMETPELTIDFGLSKAIKCTACLEDKEV